MNFALIILIYLNFVAKCQSDEDLVINGQIDSNSEYEEENDGSNEEVIQSEIEDQNDINNDENNDDENVEIDQNGNYVGYPVDEGEAEAEEHTNPLQSDDDDVPDIPLDSNEAYEDSEGEDNSKEINEQNKSDLDISGYPDVNMDNVNFDETSESDQPLDDNNVQYSPSLLENKPKIKSRKFEDLYPDLLKNGKIKNSDDIEFDDTDNYKKLFESIVKDGKRDHQIEDKTNNQIHPQNDKQSKNRQEIGSNHLNSDNNSSLPIVDTKSVITKQMSERGSDSISEDKRPVTKTADSKGKLLVPKRQRRILARYKVIIPVIVPNLRVKVPRKKSLKTQSVS